MPLHLFSKFRMIKSWEVDLSRELRRRKGRRMSTFFVTRGDVRTLGSVECYISFASFRIFLPRNRPVNMRGSIMVRSGTRSMPLTYRVFMSDPET